ncbi:MAG: acyl carrier protein [Oscillochloris sp.]|nr:acyl carrier protein [Oscillochloris sp.]
MNRFALRKIVAEGLEIDPELLEPDTDLTTIETFDSVAVLMLMLALDEQAGIKMSPEEASRLHYYRDFETLADRHGIVLTD